MHALKDWSPPRLVNVSEDRPQLCRLIFPPSAIDLASSCEKPIHVPKTSSRPLSKSNGLWTYLWCNLTHR